jgi:H+/Cl- antiporter ClcA
MKSNLNRILSVTISLIIIALTVGSISAFFLVSLDWVTEQRESNFTFIYFLPIGGALIGYGYYYLDKEVKGGNNLLIKEMILPTKKIHWKLTPLVLFGTLATHLFGGSAGREGTAVQMGGATADQFNGLFKLHKVERKLLLRMGVAAGFAGVFGTPIAAILFALELGRDKKFNYKWILPILGASYLSDFVCHSWNVEHTSYAISQIPALSSELIAYTVIAGIIFGLCALVFNLSKVYLTNIFNHVIKHPPYRPIVGGGILLAVILLLGTTKYVGLGIPYIQDAFVEPSSAEVFIIKLLLTAFTLAAGFKGGEATPLFFMGATLGSFLIIFIPLPLSLLAGLGFIAVFSGATNTPIACILMGCELFGFEGIVYFSIVCLMAYIITGNTSVYKTQQMYLHKISVLDRFRSNPKKNDRF